MADARFAKPLDRDLILTLARDHDALITIEEGAVGGFGSHVAQLLSDEGVFDRGLKFRSMVLPDILIYQSSPSDMYETAGLYARHIEEKVLSVLGVEVIGKRIGHAVREILEVAGEVGDAQVRVAMREAERLLDRPAPQEDDRERYRLAGAVGPGEESSALADLNTETEEGEGHGGEAQRLSKLI